MLYSSILWYIMENTKALPEFGGESKEYLPALKDGQWTQFILKSHPETVETEYGLKYVVDVEIKDHSQPEEELKGKTVTWSSVAKCLKDLKLFMDLDKKDARLCKAVTWNLSAKIDDSSNKTAYTLKAVKN